MKEIITFIITVAMCFALTACGNRISTESGNDEYKNSTGTHISDNVNTNKDSITEEQKVVSVGPWHLDQEKTDISAIEAAWETFPGYGEWGAGMEIRSSGQISWYIGAAGGSGFYTVEGDILHAELTDTMEQKELSMDLMLIEEDSIMMTYADLQIIWAYGDQEN